MRVWIYTFKWPSYLSVMLLGMIIVYVGYVYHQGTIEEQIAHQEVVSFAVADKVVAIDPGHGGVDPGASGAHGAVEEDITLDVALKLKTQLEQGGANVLMTREEDKDWSTSEKGYSKKKREDLKHRAEIIEEAESDLLISIHVNAVPSGKWFGAQTFYSDESEESKVFAEAIQENLVKRLGNTTREARPINSFILNNTDVTGVIVEVGFISNSEEAKLMLDSVYQEKMAMAIYEGVVQYFKDK